MTKAIIDSGLREIQTVEIEDEKMIEFINQRDLKALEKEFQLTITIESYSLENDDQAEEEKDTDSVN